MLRRGTHRPKPRQNAHNSKNEMRGEACIAEDQPQREGGCRQDLETTDRAQRTAASGRSPHTHPERYKQCVVDEPLDDLSVAPRTGSKREALTTDRG
jgi:hypothetical protein